MQLRKGDYIMVIPLFYLWLSQGHPITTPNFLQLPLCTPLVAINPLIHHLSRPLQEDPHTLPQEGLGDPLMLVVLIPMMEEVHLEVEVSLMGMVLLCPLIVVPLLGIDLGISLRQEHPLVIESIEIVNYPPSWCINRLSWDTS